MSSCDSLIKLTTDSTQRESHLVDTSAKRHSHGNQDRETSRQRSDSPSVTHKDIHVIIRAVRRCIKKRETKNRNTTNSVFRLLSQKNLSIEFRNHYLEKHFLAQMCCCRVNLKKTSSDLEDKYSSDSQIQEYRLFKQIHPIKNPSALNPIVKCRCRRRITSGIF